MTPDIINMWRQSEILANDLNLCLKTDGKDLNFEIWKGPKLIKSYQTVVQVFAFLKECKEGTKAHK